MFHFYAIGILVFILFWYMGTVTGNMLFGTLVGILFGVIVPGLVKISMMKPVW